MLKKIMVASLFVGIAATSGCASPFGYRWDNMNNVCYKTILVIEKDIMGKPTNTKVDRDVEPVQGIKSPQKCTR